MFFKDCKTLEEVKKAYKRFALMFHPDRPGGNLEMMQQLNNEYNKMFEYFQKKAYAQDTHYETTETADTFKDIINAIINLDGLVIEICGSWIWVTGNTKEHKEILKATGFSFSAKKTAWYWHEGTFHKSKKQYSLDEIRAKYGSDLLKGNLLGANA